MNYELEIDGNLYRGQLWGDQPPLPNRRIMIQEFWCSMGWIQSLNTPTAVGVPIADGMPEVPDESP